MGDVTDYVTVAEAAGLLGVSKSRVEQFIRDEKKLTVAASVGGVRLLLKKDVVALKPFIRGKSGRPPKSPPPPEKPKRKRGAQ